MSPLRFDLDDPSASSSFSFPSLAPRPEWPYRLGALAGLMCGASILALLLASQMGQLYGEAVAFLAHLGAALGGALLGIAWLVIRGHGHHGLGAIAGAAGSFALPLGFAYVWFIRAQDSRTAAFAIVGGLAAFGWSHALAAGLGAARMFATCSALLWSIVFAGMLRGWSPPPPLVTFALLATSLTGICLAVSFPSLRHAGLDDEWD